MGYMDEIVKSIDEYREDITELRAEAAKWQSLYLGVCTELATTRAELEPWHEMARMIEENVTQFEVRISEGMLDKTKSWVDFVEYDSGDVWSAEGDDLPEAVNAAYQEVVSDE